MGYRSYTYEDYIRAMKMIKRGFKPREISRISDIPEGTVKGWKYGKVPPLATWHPEPSKELAYIIGVLNGDGYLYTNGYNHKIRLGVKDYEFAKTFSKNMAKTLNKKYSMPRWNKSKSEWRTEYNSKVFYTWYEEQTLETLKPFIEHNKETVANFLRGLYDSDGGHHKYKKRYSQIRLSNNNIELLKYVQYLLKKYLGIITTGPYLNIKAGTESKMKNGKIAKANHNNYRIVISRKQHMERFLYEIGFSILEKQLGLPRRK